MPLLVPGEEASSRYCTSLRPPLRKGVHRSAEVLLPTTGEEGRTVQVAERTGPTNLAD